MNPAGFAGRVLEALTERWLKRREGYSGGLKWEGEERGMALGRS